jgi:hypothetical protein
MEGPVTPVSSDLDRAAVLKVTQAVESCEGGRSVVRIGRDLGTIGRPSAEPAEGRRLGPDPTRMQLLTLTLAGVRPQL